MLDAMPSVAGVTRSIARRVASVVPPAVYRGRDFYRRAAWLDQSQWWPAERLRAYQDERLAALIRHAVATVPYYRDTFARLGLRPEDVTSVDDLPRLPTLTKDDVRGLREQLRSSAIPESQVTWKSTSGTTGRPLHVAILNSLLPFDNDAYHWRQFRWGGCSYSDRRVTLLASTLSGAAETHRRRLYSYDPRRRTLTLSSYDLHASTIGEIARAIQRYRPAFLMAFPSAAERLVVLLERARLTLPPLRAVFLQSESVLPFQRDLLSRYFGCQVFDWYATEERVINACDCPEHDGLHIVAEFGIVEFLPTSSTEDDGAYEIVATPLHNLAMPLIRYRTGDMAVPIAEPCPCGRGLPRMRLVGGRSRSYVVLKDGRLVSITVVDIPKAAATVEQFQFVQERPGEVTLYIVRGPGYSDADEATVRRNLLEKFGDALTAHIVYTDAIERTARGKRPLLVQRLDLSQYE